MSNRFGPIRFAHFRLRTERYETSGVWGISADDREIVDPKGGVTLAFQEGPDRAGETSDAPPILYVAAAVCSVKDHYCKALGRAIAAGRLQSRELRCGSNRRNRAGRHQIWLLNDVKPDMKELRRIAQDACGVYGGRLDVSKLATLHEFWGRKLARPTETVLERTARALEASEVPRV